MAAAAGTAADAFVKAAPKKGTVRNTANMGRPTDRDTENLRRLSVDIAKDLHKSLKTMATEREETVVTLVERYLTEGMERDRAKAAKGK